MADSKTLSQVRQDLRIKWYRSPIEIKTLRELSKPSDIEGFRMALGHLLLWFCSGYACYTFYHQEFWLLFVLALSLHGTIGSFFNIAHHELCHKTVFKTKWLNSFFLRIFCFFGWLNFHVYIMSHSYHHRFTLFHEADKEVVLPENPKLSFLHILQIFTFNITGSFESRGILPIIKYFSNTACNRFGESFFNYWDEELYKDAPIERMKAVKWARMVLFGHFLILIFSLAIGEPILILLLSVHLFIGTWLRYFVGVPMHCGLRSNVADFRKSTRTIILNPLFEFLYWHMNWHIEHHMFAGVPCYNLKKLHKIVDHDMPKPRTLFGAWLEMRKTWLKQLENPKYEFDTHVPSERKIIHTRDEEGLAGSIGELAPNEINFLNSVKS